jgi:hypothetical protein
MISRPKKTTFLYHPQETKKETSNKSYKLYSEGLQIHFESLMVMEGFVQDLMIPIYIFRTWIHILRMQERSIRRNLAIFQECQKKALGTWLGT